MHDGVGGSEAAAANLAGHAKRQSGCTCKSPQGARLGAEQAGVPGALCEAGVDDLRGNDRIRVSERVTVLAPAIQERGDELR